MTNSESGFVVFGIILITVGAAMLLRYGFLLLCVIESRYVLSAFMPL